MSCGGLGGQGSESTASQLVALSLLQQADLPDSHEWEVEEAVSDPSQEEFEKALDDCEARLDPTADVALAERDSDTFVRGDDLTASSTGWVVREAAEREAFFASIDQQLGCARRVVLRYLRSLAGADMGVEMAPAYTLDVKTAADRTAGRSLQFGLDLGPGVKRTFYLDLVVLEEGDLLASYLFLHSGELTPGMQTDVVERCLRRVTDAAG